MAKGHLIQSVLIQTTQKCTRRCKHCFYGQFDYTSNEIMATETVRKILNDLRDMKYDGRVSLYANNDPLTDPRILMFVMEARTLLPRAYHFLQTNGDLLTSDLALQLLENLDMLQVNLYGNKKLPQGFPFEHPRTHVTNKMNRGLTEWSNKGGHLHGMGNSPSQTCCKNPFQQMYINPAGKVLICTADGFATQVMGNVQAESIADIWRGEPFQSVRNKLLTGERGTLPLCSRCDSTSGQLMELRRGNGKI